MAWEHYSRIVSLEHGIPRRDDEAMHFVIALEIISRRHGMARRGTSGREMRVVADRVHAHFWASSGGLWWTWDRARTAAAHGALVEGGALRDGARQVSAGGRQQRQQQAFSQTFDVCEGRMATG